MREGICLTEKSFPGMSAGNAPPPLMNISCHACRAGKCRRLEVYPALLLLFLFICGGARGASYEVRGYDAALKVSRNAAVSVTERISVFFSGYSHGLYRTIPTALRIKRLVNGHEKEFLYRLKVEDVEVQGEEFSCGRKEDEGRSLVIRAGSPDRLRKGEAEYVFSYTVELPDDLVGEYDEFYYNIAGTDWEVPLEKVSFSIAFDKPADLSEFRMYRGIYGSRDESGINWSVSGNTVRGTVDGGLPAHEGLTAFLRLPEGYFEGARKPPSFLISVFAILCAGLAVLAVRLMFLSRRDFSRETRPPSAAPPGLDSASLAFVRGGAPRSRLLLSLIPWLVSRRYLEVREKEGTISVRLIKRVDDHLPPHVRTFLHGLFPSGKKHWVPLGSFQSGFSRVLEKSFRQLEDGFRGERRLENGLAGRMMLLAFAVSLAASCAISLAGWHHSFKVHFGAIMGGTIVLGFLGIGMIYTSGRQSGRGLWNRAVLPALCMAGLLFGVAAAFRILADAVMVNFYYEAWLWGCLASVCAAFLALAFAAKESPYKRNVASEGAQLLAFMKHADPEQIRQLAVENPDGFWKLLPYAYAWGVEDAWIRKIEPWDISCPSWYRSGAGAVPVRAYAAAWALSRSLNESLLAIPSGLGSGSSLEDAGFSSFVSGRGAGSTGGGGFSGGGFGGGGGGSW